MASIRIFLLLLLLPILALADDLMDDSVLIGHNVTPTTDTLKSGVATVGTYAVGYGFSDSFFLATSPWIWGSYNTANLHAKWAQNISNSSRLGIFASYFESYESQPFLKNAGTLNGNPGGSRPGRGGSGGGGGPSLPNTGATTIYTALERYQWKSASTHALYSYEAQSGVVYYFNVHYAYFWNDDFPYSIRMDPGSDEIRNQVDFTTLTKIPLSDNWLLLFELGGLGLNYLYPYLQTGASIAYKDSSWLLQVGASYTAQFAELNKSTAWSPGRYDTRTHETAEGQTYYYRYLQTALHPEVQLQFFF